MKKIIIILLLFNLQSYSQQVPLYSQYYFNPFIYNPAMTGIEDLTKAALINRSQWTDIPGAPVTRVLTLDGPIKSEKVGLGLSIFNDVTDITERFGTYASYSYRVLIKDEHNLLFGIAIGTLDNRIDFSKVVANDPNDQLLFNQDQRKITIDANFGVAYLWKQLEFGFAIPQIIGNSMEYVNSDARTYYNLSRHLLVSAKYKFIINEEKNISCYPLVLMRAASGAPIQYDINAVLNWKDIGWFAVSYRSDYAVGVNATIKLHKNISVGYAYDIIINSINTYAGTSHEIMLGYTFGKPDVKIFEDLTGEGKKKEEELSISLPYRIFNDSTSKEKLKLLIEEEEMNGRSTEDIITTKSSSYYLDDNGYRAKQGYYLIVGSFEDDESADSLIDNSINKGYRLIYNDKTKRYYVYTPQTFEEALDELKKARDSEYPESWILILE